MASKFSFRNVFLAILLSLAIITILSLLLSQYTNLQEIKSGKAFLIIFISCFLGILFLFSYDQKLDKSEIWTLLLVAGLLTLSFWALRTYIPEIFSSLPSSAKSVFSAIAQINSVGNLLSAFGI